MRVFHRSNQGHPAGISLAAAAGTVRIGLGNEKSRSARVAGEALCHFAFALLIPAEVSLPVTKLGTC